MQIVGLHDVYESATHIFLVQELCEGGSLSEVFKKPGPLNEERAASLFRGIVKALLHCHQMGVLHRDIKPENFLLSDAGPEAIVKLADFGLSVFFHRGVLQHEGDWPPDAWYFRGRLGITIVA